MKLIVVSNRLPVTIERKNDQYEYARSSGGLVSALDGVQKTTDFVWLGWLGQHVPESDRVQVTNDLVAFGCLPVFLESEIADGFYNGFSNE